MYLLISLPTTYIAFSYGNVHALTYCFTVCKNISFVNFPVLYAQCLKSFIVCTFRIDYYLDYYLDYYYFRLLFRLLFLFYISLIVSGGFGWEEGIH